jgi:hypothetical protein
LIASSRYDTLRAALREAVLATPGALPRAEREALVARAVPDGPLSAYVTALREHAHRVTDADLAALAAGGLSAEAIFEATVSTALGASLHRLDRAHAAMEAADADS